MKRLVLKVIIIALLSLNSIFAGNYEQNILFNNGDLSFGGTLALPDTINIHPVIVLVTGSGQQKRDEEIFGFKIFKEISDYLVENGYAVYRFDDRGVGESKNSNLSFDSVTIFDFAEDAISALRKIKNHKNIDKNRIGMLGHSEGGIIVSYLANKYPNEIDFLVLMASPAVAGKYTSNYQIEVSNRNAGITDEGIDTILKYQNKLNDAICERKSKEEMNDILVQSFISSYNFLPEEMKKSITDLKLYSKIQAKNQLKFISSPYVYNYMCYDPINAIKNIKIPILAIYGEKDKQVPAEMNITELEKLIKNTNIEITIIKDANHLFQKAYTGDFSEYANLEKKFTDGFLQTMLNWLNKSVNKNEIKK